MCQSPRSQTHETSGSRSVRPVQGPWTMGRLWVQCAVPSPGVLCLGAACPAPRAGSMESLSPQGTCVPTAPDSPASALMAPLVTLQLGLGLTVTE